MVVIEFPELQLSMCLMYFVCRLEVPEHMVINVYKAASLLKVANVAEACSEYLAHNLTLQNCLGESSTERYSGMGGWEGREWQTSHRGTQL